MAINKVITADEAVAGATVLPVFKHLIPMRSQTTACDSPQ